MSENVDTKETEPTEPVIELTRLPVKREVATAGAPRSMMDLVEQLASEDALRAATAISTAYDNACRAVLSEHDIVKFADGREAKNKSAWRKLGRTFYISTSLVFDKHDAWADVDENGVPHLNAVVCVRGEAPWGQSTEALGACSTREDRFMTTLPLCPVCDGPMWDNRKFKGEPAWKQKLRDEGKHFTCKSKTCPGYVSLPVMSADQEDEEAAGLWRAAMRALFRSKPNPTARARAFHDVLATAQTRATNRAISDIIAAGEVSAEELEGAGLKPQAAAERDTAASTAEPTGGPVADPGLLDRTCDQGPHAKAGTWHDVLMRDPDAVATLIGWDDGTIQVQDAALATTLEAALYRVVFPTEAQLDRLRTLLDTRSFENTEFSPRAEQMRAWAGDVLSNRTKVSYGAMREALGKIESLPEKIEVEAAAGEPDDDLPF